MFKRILNILNAANKEIDKSIPVAKDRQRENALADQKDKYLKAQKLNQYKNELQILQNMPDDGLTPTEIKRKNMHIDYLKKEIERLSA